MVDPLGLQVLKQLVLVVVFAGQVLSVERINVCQSSHQLVKYSMHPNVLPPLPGF